MVSSPSKTRDVRVPLGTEGEGNVVLYVKFASLTLWGF